MYLREAPTLTLKDVREKLDDKSETVITNTHEINVDLTGDRIIGFANKQVPVTKRGIEIVGNLVDVPSAFLKRLDTDLQEHLLRELLRRTPGDIAVRFNDDGINDMHDARKEVIEPRRLVDAAMNALDKTAPVVDYWMDPTEFRIDTVVPEGFDRGIGGDVPKRGVKRVGDVTRGGVRIGQDRKRNLSPWAQPYLYRLACTNGMEMTDDGLKIDARGASAEETIAAFEDLVERAFSRVEKDIETFYALRNERVEHPERVILRFAQEQRLPERLRMELIESVPAYLGDGEATMFDLVNLITNQGNNPDITREGTRRQFERFGGAIVTDHAARCQRCQSRLN